MADTGKPRGATSLETLDRTLRLLRSVYGSDKVFRVVAYGAKVLAAVLKETSASPRLMQAVAGVGGNVSMSRYVVRTWGVLECVSALAHQAQQPPTDVDGVLQLLQNLSMLVYYPIDTYTYVHYTSPGVFDAQRVAAAERIGCGLWLLWTVLELWRIRRARAAAGDADALTPQRSYELWCRGVGTLADTVLATHWTVKGGIGLSDPVVGALGCIAGVTGLYCTWQNTP